MIAIINYEMGNLRSVQKALEKVGHQAEVTDEPQAIAAADKLILPGVGAFADAIAALRERKLIEPIRQAVADGTPTLGICLGMQLLFETSYEDGKHQGLGILPGEVVRFEVPHEYKVPHMGWNQITKQKDSPLFEGIDQGAYFYFVHSYYVVPTDPSVTATTTDYPDPFTSSVQQGNLFATQFHPEKSQRLGLKLLENFAAL
ncbi:imidazole glycerol phosphate synthase subunit HisH [Aeoliella sp. ICT_H6.2]|uniref:Imidazole glycerol phosphate synthase subunit HisH n=1 Tax=Aeoliella straminimaris TaxID=2954799 RepID=A0A9X2FJ06_9BACT|nr:imidazole glycerol phosphate synthase subunit HisH [Aeoliella straminimaris]MCO6047691.1 imidazole glycerol phosphate synthase subunit HisH [Aeoliella straminimaris]